MATQIIYLTGEENEITIPAVTDCMRIDSELHIQLFFKGATVTLPQ